MGNSQDSNEPVAWLTPGQDLHLNNGEGFRFSDWTPLYTTPPQRLPLTEDEIFKIENDIPDDVISDRAWTIWFTRAIEAKHGIGGEE